MKLAKNKMEMTGALPEERDVLSTLNKELKIERLIIKNLQDIALEMLSHPLPSERGEYLTFFVLSGLLAKAVKTIRAMTVLTHHGLAADAHGLFRTLLMTSAAARWICTDKGDTPNRAQQYMDVTLANENTFKNAAERDPNMKDFLSGELGERLQELVSNLKQKHTSEGLRKLARKSPWGSDEELCRSTFSSVGYNLTYRRASGILHALDVLDHIYLDENYQPILKPLATDHWSHELIDMAALVFVLLLEACNERLALQLEQRIAQVAARAEARRKELRSKARSHR